jgi:membrane fusion protein, multidrug efflux system
MNDVVAPPVPPSTSGTHRSAWLLLGIVLLILITLFLLGYLPRLYHSQRLAADSQATASQLRVRVTTPKPAPPTIDLHLTGSVEALRETSIYARSNGYVRSWSADLGEHVKEGQLLVELDAPEMIHLLGEGEANLAKSRASLEQVKANLALAKVQLQRARTLGAGVTSQQEIDIRQATNDAETANVQASEAAVRADIANVNRLLQLKSFSKVLAPFAGTITYRGLEVGELVTAGSGSNSKVLYHVAQTNQVRVMVDVPQSAATAFTIGLIAKIIPRPGISVNGTVAHIARALDPSTRTMRAEILVENVDGALMPGMYVQTQVMLPNQRPLMMLNSNVLISGSKGPQIAVIDHSDIAHLKTVIIELDTGGEIGLASEVTTDDRVMLNPPAGLEDNTPVMVLPTPVTGTPNAATSSSIK